MAEAADLPEKERDLVADAIRSLPRRSSTVANRHAVIAARVAQVRAGDVAGFSAEDVERSIRKELDF